MDADAARSVDSGAVRITVLGSSGTYPAADNPASSFLITTDAHSIWCDAGPGSFAALARLMDPADLDAIVLSHRHPDHCLDVLAAYHALAYRPVPVGGIPLLAGTSVFDRLFAFLDAGGDHRIHSTFDIVVMEEGERYEIGDITVTPVEMSHTAPTFGTSYRAGGRGLFYTADTGRGPWMDAVGPVDLLICEATLRSGSEDGVGHMSASEAGRIAREIEAARLLLTHIPPHLDPKVSVREAERTFGGPVAWAEPGATHEV